MKTYSIYALILGLCMACGSNPTEKTPVKNAADTLSTRSSNEKRTFLDYYPSGKLRVNGFMQGEKRVDTWSSWFESGEKKSEAFYEDGLKSGEYRVWYRNGKLQVYGNYEAGQPIGTWISYDSTGQKISEKKYDM